MELIEARKKYRNEELPDWLSNQGGRYGLRMWHMLVRTKVRRCFWGNLQGRRHLAGLGIDGRIILKWIWHRTDRRLSVVRTVLKRVVL